MHNRANSRDVTDEHSYVLESLLTMILARQSISGCLLIGSMESGTADIFSDIDFYVYDEHGFWNMHELSSWMDENSVELQRHYWTGLDKHRLLINGVRVDMSIRPNKLEGELKSWPEVFFSKDAIVKDRNGVLTEAYAQHRARSYRDPDCDQDAWVLNLYTVAAQLIRGEVVGGKSRSTGLIESRSRLYQSLDLGSAQWREPSRHVEERLTVPQLHELYKLAFQSSPDEFKDLVTTELLAVAESSSSASEREMAAGLARILASKKLHSY